MWPSASFARGSGRTRRRRSAAARASRSRTSIPRWRGAGPCGRRARARASPDRRDGGRSIAPSASARSQNGPSDGWSRYCPLVWPLIMRAANFSSLHAAFELVGGGFGVLHRQVGEAGVAIRALLDFACEEIVGGFARLADGGGGVALGLHAGAGEDEHRARDAGAIHRLRAAARRSRSAARAPASRMPDRRRRRSASSSPRSPGTGSALPARSSKPFIPRAFPACVSLRPLVP